MWKRELSSTLKSTSPVCYVLKDKTANWITEKFAAGENPTFLSIYSRPVQEGGHKLLKCPHYCIVPPLRRLVLTSPHSSLDDFLLETDALACIFSTPPLLNVINAYIFLMFFYLWLLRPSAKLFFYIAFLGSACFMLSHCVRQKHDIDLRVQKNC